VGWLSYGTEECKECSSRCHLVCKLGGGYLVLDEGVKDFVGKDDLVVIQILWSSLCRICLVVELYCLSYGKLFGNL